MKPIPVLVLLAHLLLGGTLAAQKPLGCDARLTPLLDSMRAVIEAEDLPSIAFAVAQRGEVLCEVAMGWADREARRVATPYTMYSLASISKPITATAVMQLVERGAVELDAPANRYLTAGGLRAFAGDVADATVRRLLTHTAGLPLHYQFFYAGGPGTPTMEEAIARWGVVVYTPGERWVYANFGYGVLDHIIARVSGRSYAEYLRDELFRPLGLARTSVSDGSDLGDEAAVRYYRDGTPVPPYTFDHVGASAVWSSAHDLVRFGMFHLGDGGHVLSRASIARMQESQVPTGSPDAAWGLGWAIDEDDNGYRRVSHTGGMPGVTAVLGLFPAEELAVVALTNTNSGAVMRVASAAAAALLPGYAEERRRRLEAREAEREAPEPRDPGDAFPAPAALRGTWRGEAVLPDGPVPVVLEADHEGVRVRIGEQPVAELERARYDDGWLTGRLDRRLAAPDATPAAVREEHAIGLELRLEGDRLAGWAAARSTSQVVYGAVSFPVVLERTGTRR